MGLNPNYIPLSSYFEQYFADKDTGLPLAAGIVTFYEDQARTMPKSVFSISGTPPNYIYTDLGNRLVLGINGTFVDNNGNPIVVYGFPYDQNGNIELYYITCYSSIDGGITPAIEQFVREGVPNIASADNVSGTVKNYIPNGQFLAHTNLAADATHVAGEIRAPITIIGQGGWSFERPSGSTAKDIVTFERFATDVLNPTGSPRYSCRIQNEGGGGGDAFKDLRIKFRDVNKFSSSAQTYTHFFTATSNTASTVNVSLILIKNFGTGGDTQTETVLATLTINPVYTGYNTSFIFGTNIGKNIGLLDDDFTQIAIRFPTGTVFDVSVTDEILTDDTVIIPFFPPITNAQTLSVGVAGWMPTPAHDGSDLYLPLRLTPSGLEFDHSEIGQPVFSLSPIPGIGQLPTDNLAAQYKTTDYSSDGIPYSRLQSFLFNHGIPSIANIPMFGTGAGFITAYLKRGVTNQLRIPTNQPGAVTPASDGAIPTNFTINTIATGYNSITTGYWNDSSDVFAVSNNLGAAPAPSPGTSGFVTSDLINNPLYYHVYRITGVVGTSTLAGKYWAWNDNVTAYYMWFTVDGSGSDPAPGGTGIKVALLSTDTGSEYMSAVKEALSGQQITTIVFKAGSLITPGSYFIVNTITNSYYVWYQVSGAGSDPSPSGKIGILVSVLSADTDAQVALKTQIAINSFYFATPFCAGMFIRAVDKNEIWDFNVGGNYDRFSILSGVSGTDLSMFPNYEMFTTQYQTYSATSISTASTNANTINSTGSAVSGSTSPLPGNATVTVSTSTSVAPTGTSQTQPINTSFYLYIKY